ncbi:MAG TPA: alpha/beta hydrolase [Actinophytocola sp.]|uniref:alpha/beta fold hydrolase n=1 Tax=Actinophytocola sp. TaxID=1872138 RepID=UPI002DDCAF0E|nr:alpha/beta hydrolase [Actinophytocola sp.]HEV2779194.1 alpha/beta hydrolase [Actinophytocola sp.]
MSAFSLRGAGRTRLAVRASGRPGRPPIVFVHGWARSSLDWAAQMLDPELIAGRRLLAVDLRGHGESEVADGGYDDPEAWAGDLAVVLDHAGSPAVLVGHSYGGLVIIDYLRTRGAAGVAGVVLTGAITEIGAGNPGGAVGPLMGAGIRDYLAEDPAVAVPALTRLAAGLTAEPAPGEVIQRRLGEFLRVPPRVRRAMFTRAVGSADVLAALRMPVLVMHGTEDAVVAPSAAEYAAGKIPGASLRWLQGVGHLPFAERSAEFNTALREFADRCGRALP